MAGLTSDNEEHVQSRSPSPPGMRMLRRGSDAFQAVLRQLHFQHEDSLTNLDSTTMSFLDGVSKLQREKTKNDEAKSDKDSTDGRTQCDSNSSSPSSSDSDVRHHRRRGRRQSLHHVQWVDECYILPVAYEPSDNEKHGARIFIKTVPKSILKA